jgi:hypothetical protein
MDTNFDSPVVSLAFGALLVALSSNLFAAERLTSGQYEFAMTTDGATRKFSQCITPSKAAEVNGDTASGRALAEKNANGRCKVDAYEAAGDQVSYTLTCGDRVIRSVTTFHGDSSLGSLATTAQGKTTTAQVSARRVGACP